MNPRIIKVLGDLSKITEDYTYCFGSRAITQQVKTYINEGMFQIDELEEVQVENSPESQEVGAGNTETQIEEEEDEPNYQEAGTSSKDLNPVVCNKKPIKWSRRMKRQVLKLFLTHAPDPSSKALLRLEQCLIK